MFVNNDYNGPLDSYYKIMKHIVILIFGINHFCTYLSIFNQPFEISPRIKKIYFSSPFNQNIKLTKCIKLLKFGDYFNKQIVLNKNIIYVSFGTRFNSEIIISKNLKHLVFDTGFNKTFCLPKHIHRLTISCNYNNYCVFDCVTNTKNLHLVILCNNWKINDNLPNGLKNVLWGTSVERTLKNLPNDLYK